MNDGGVGLRPAALRQAPRDGLVFQASPACCGTGSAEGGLQLNSPAGRLTTSPPRMRIIHDEAGILRRGRSRTAWHGER